MSALTAVAEVLDDIDCHSYSLTVTDKTFWSARNPDMSDGVRVNLRLMIVGRTAFEAFCLAIEARPQERIVNPGQRSWWAESDTKTRRLLVEGVSFQHHEDWEPRPKSKAKAGAR